MKKLSLILVALATMVMVGCKPLTGSTVCTDHIEGEGVLTKEPACGVEGEKTFYCKVCDTKLRTEVVPAADHKEGEGWYTNSKVKGTEYGVDSTGAYYLALNVETDSCYGEQCPNCKRFNHKKTDAFFNSDTTIGVAIDVIGDKETKEWFLPIDEKLIKFYNRYFGEVVKNKGNTDWTYYCSCSCNGGCGCQETCNCGPNDSDDPDNCVRSYLNTVYFGDYYITVPNN